MQLFRGDGDYSESRKLRTLLDRGLVQTNLVNGGNGRQIFEKPIIENIQNHVTDNWKTTHFLSFTESFEVAIDFGRGRRNASKEFDEYLDERNSWDFIVFSIESNTLDQLRELSPGVYSTSFVPSFKQFLPVYNIVLIDVVKVLSNAPKSDLIWKNALDNAKRDLEWLLLPAATTNLGRGTEFRGLLDCVIFSEISKYQFTY